MAAQAEKPKKKDRSEVAPVPKKVDAQQLKEEMDTLLEAIDASLEVNALEFVQNYRQAGGQ